MRRPLDAALVLAVGALISTTAFACGDKLILTIGNLRFRQINGSARPASILAYTPRNSPVGEVLKQLEQQSAGKRAGLTFQSFDDPDRLDEMLRANRFDLLLVDAFSSDSVPAHLLTVEAMRAYLDKIKPDGIVIMHLSNRNLELMSPVAGIAQAAGGAALQQAYRPPNAVLEVDPSEDAIIVARSAAALAPYRLDRHWAPAMSHGIRMWTDDYSNLFGAMVRRLAY